MNKDLDERLMPDGEYRDALNIQVSSTEDSDAGTAQNIRGNKLLKDYNDVKYNNYKLLYSSKEMQKEVFIKGISGSLDIP